MKTTITTLALVTMSGSALAQSGLDIDRAYAAELRADANTRSSLLGSNAGSLDVEVFTQFRYTYNARDEIAPGVVLGDADTTVGFSTPRTRISMSGGVEGTDITGHVSFDFGGAFDHGASGAAGGDGGATLRDAYATWGLDDNWTFLFGQMKNPLHFESNVAAQHSQGVERSLTNSFFDVGYAQGIGFNYTDDEWKFTVVLSDGPVSQNSYYTGAEADFSLTGRVDWLVSGNWDQFADFASWQGSNSGFRVGAGVHWSQAGDTNPSLAPIDTATVTAWTVDAQYEADGWGLFAAYMSTNVDNDLIAGGSVDQTDEGLVLQGNFFFTEQFEAFARYDMIILDDDPAAITPLAATDDDAYSNFTVGFNYYLVPESYAARFSMDVTFGLDDSTGLDTRGFADVATTGYIGGGAAAATGIESDLMIRGQFSLLF
jgi:phosphate-selective porin O/P